MIKNRFQKNKTCKKTFKRLLELLIVCQILDGLLTYYGLNYVHNNLNYEANEFVKSILISYGILDGLILIKCIGILILYLVILNIHHLHKKVKSKIKLTIYKFLIIIVLSFYIIRAIIPWVILLIF